MGLMSSLWPVVRLLHDFTRLTRCISRACMRADTGPRHVVTKQVCLMVVANFVVRYERSGAVLSSQACLLQHPDIS